MEKLEDGERIQVKLRKGYKVDEQYNDATDSWVRANDYILYANDEGKYCFEAHYCGTNGCMWYLEGDKVTIYNTVLKEESAVANKQ